MKKTFKERVLKVVAKIPKGKVLSYDIRPSDSFKLPLAISSEAPFFSELKIPK